MNQTRIMMKSKIHRAREHKPSLVRVDANNASVSTIPTAEAAIA